MKVAFVAICACLLSLGLAYPLFGGAALADGPATPSFSADIVPIFNNKCVSCHMDSASPGNLGLAPKQAYGELVSKPSSEAKFQRVKPGDPAKSYLYMKLKGTHLDQGGSGTRMPQGAAPLSAVELKIIESWIADGAPKN